MRRHWGPRRPAHCLRAYQGPARPARCAQARPTRARRPSATRQPGQAPEGSRTSPRGPGPAPHARRASSGGPSARHGVPGGGRPGGDRWQVSGGRKRGPVRGGLGWAPGLLSPPGAACRVGARPLPRPRALLQPLSAPAGGEGRRAAAWLWGAGALRSAPRCRLQHAQEAGARAAVGGRCVEPVAGCRAL